MDTKRDTLKRSYKEISLEVTDRPAESVVQWFKIPRRGIGTSSPRSVSPVESTATVISYTLPQLISASIEDAGVSVPESTPRDPIVTEMTILAQQLVDLIQRHREQLERATTYIQAWSTEYANVLAAHLKEFLCDAICILRLPLMKSYPRQLRSRDYALLYRPFRSAMEYYYQTSTDLRIMFDTRSKVNPQKALSYDEFVARIEAVLIEFRAVALLIQIEYTAKRAKIMSLESTGNYELD